MFSFVMAVHYITMPFSQDEYVHATATPGPTCIACESLPIAKGTKLEMHSMIH